ncbi:uncharacterized protein LOC111715549 isoform X2 [Eurytemora carolleeae]|uniref:uncharacterized protein LOC111715549 isoform X2 n=1 Tax=Eurytemora carolleeae TaxID=1294199 RepID=UPI000C75AE9A|nr:uncharacterized protein LOC111715549 isoform X2 [Eurytemora carolleeae]|eukprot:XP_023346674.1 uncharacterized protein LOC111715549 isoform X2 [Eurytemora affinis]
MCVQWTLGIFFFILLTKRVPCKTYLIKLDKGHKPINIATPEAEGADYQDLDHQYNLHEISALLGNQQPFGKLNNKPEETTAEPAQNSNTCKPGVMSTEMSDDLKTADWIKNVKPCTLVDRILDFEFFTIRKAEEGSPVTINGFPVTTEEYQKALDGHKVGLKNPEGKEAILSAIGKNVQLDGKSLTSGNKLIVNIKTFI